MAARFRLICLFVLAMGCGAVLFYFMATGHRPLELPPPPWVGYAAITAGTVTGLLLAFTLARASRWL